MIDFGAVYVQAFAYSAVALIAGYIVADLYQRLWKREEPAALSAQLLEELGNVIEHEPLFPGDTCAHEDAAELERRGYIERLGTGDWVSTKSGREVWARARQ